MLKSSRLRILFAVALSFVATLDVSYAQTNIRGWYKNGQVWIVWQTTPPAPETYAIYANPTIFTTTSNATLIGRIFPEEWSGLQLKLNTLDSTSTYIVPTATGYYRLALTEGVFVETVTQSGSKYYAVVKWGESAVTASNRALVSSTYSLTDPPQCHVQYVDTNPQGYRYTIYNMWIDGRDNAGRPDFPVMGNRHKTGTPHLFIVSEPQGGQQPGLVPATIFLHGGTGEGTARLSIPPARSEVNIIPAEGLIIAHEDHMFRNHANAEATEMTTQWFGYYRRFNPFTPDTLPSPTDTVINYTQRRVLWMDDWLVRNRNVDSTRIAVMGHSNGARGTRYLMKAFPHMFSSATLFNSITRMGSAVDLVGDELLNLATNLRDRNGQLVRMAQLWDLTSTFSQARDLPIARLFAAKRDLVPTNYWDASVVGELRKADSLGYGMHIYWDERSHTLPDWAGSHWAHSSAALDQTQRDNASYQSRYRSNQSFPAFYHHAGQPGNRDPGNGDPLNGNPWGTWGGYHDWDTSIVDLPPRWEVVAYLIGPTTHPVDSCPLPSLRSYLAIRKPQRFLPAPGTVVQWWVVRISTGDTLRSGTTTVGPDALVTVPNITVYRNPDKVRIIFRNSLVDVTETPALPFAFALHQNYPNPFNPTTTIRYDLPSAGLVSLKVFDILGKEVRTLVNEVQDAGFKSVRLDASGLASAVYFYRLQTEGFNHTKKLLLLR